MPTSISNIEQRILNDEVKCTSIFDIQSIAFFLLPSLHYDTTDFSCGTF